MQVFDNAGTQEYFIPDRTACTFSFTSITWCYLKFQYFNTLNRHILRECNQTVFYACFLASQKCFQMLQSNKRYEERNIKRIPKKVGVKIMEIKSILIKDTTREERKQIVEESFGNISASCDGCMAGLAEMYQEYIDGTKEIRDINMEFNAHYVREDLDEKSKRSCPM